jgi:hypothetical protein
MLHLADQYLLTRRVAANDEAIAFRRVDGTPTSRIIYFLPWHTSYRLARCAGLLPLPFMACYEMPEGIVSAQPRTCRAALDGIVRDACQLMTQHGQNPRDICLVSFSIGTFPASVIAGLLRARLFAIAAADRGDLMLWESAAVAEIKSRAMAANLTPADFAAVLDGLNPVDALAQIRSGSIFLMGRRDPFIPSARRDALISAARRHGHQVVELDCGHVGAMVASRRFQRELLAPTPAAAPLGTTHKSMRLQSHC